MKKVKLRTVILYGLCAMSWIIRVIVGFIYKEYNSSVFVFVLNILCYYNKIKVDGPDIQSGS